MTLCLALLAVSLLPVSAVDKPMVRGVSLGGWMVLEPWITPKLFDSANDGVPRQADNSFSIVDEWTWRAQPRGTQNRSSLLVDHWQTWVTQEHLQDIKSAGLTHLRIPVGYWYFVPGATGEPYDADAGIFPLALAQLKKVCDEWAKPLGLQVLLDLHTGPGSQNGFDNSGKRGDVGLLQGDNLAKLPLYQDALTKWAMANIDADVLWGIEVLNEPAAWDDNMWQAVLNTINPQGYSTVRSHAPEVNVIFQTAFRPLDQQATYAEPDYHNCWFDDHNYQCFGDDFNNLALQDGGWDTHLEYACSNASKYAAASLFTVGGEFSLAVTDCTLYLNGGMNAGCNMQQDPSCVYQGTLDQSGHSDTCDFYNQPVSNLTADYRTFLFKFARAQMDQFEAGNGWFFWNFHTEDNHAPAWDYLLGWKEGWMPQDAGNREAFC